MSSDPKSSPSSDAAPAPQVAKRAKGIRIFSYPKIIFMLPTMVVALICYFGMLAIGDKTDDPIKHPSAATAKAAPGSTAPAAVAKADRFKSPQNLFAILFLGVFAFNLLMMGLDFPRFTILAVILGVAFLVFFVLWLGAAFELELMKAIRGLMGTIYAAANAEFYLLMFLMQLTILLIVYATRWLDYWEILPNEILHHHGPLSDLERFPTINLKFDKEIPDVVEHLFLGAGRLVLHIPGETKAVVLDNVLFINSIENALKGQMSRMEVRLTTDQEVAEP
ncbi:MAG: hypothetical protein U0835_20210 [Isosphaeraceae bacterium]